MLSSHAELLKERSTAELLALCIWGEAREEPIAGKLAAGHVVRNRVRAGSWYGRNVGEVILKRRQFPCFNEEHLWKILNLATDDPELAFCRAIAELTLHAALTIDPTGGATHYHAVSCQPFWAARLVFLCRIGSRLFYREGRWPGLQRILSRVRRPAGVPLPWAVAQG